MEANAKLLRKKRVAHLGSNPLKPDCGTSIVPSDDILDRIMKESEYNDVVSYKLSQEIKSKKRKDHPHKNKVQRDSSSHSMKKLLPKKSFPLMKKCQTSLKYLEKNRCIPKPRAHVGSVPKLQVQSMQQAVTETLNFESKKHPSRATKVKKVQSKAYSKIMESDFLKSKDPKPHTIDRLIVAPKQGMETSSDHQLSSDDDDTAFENFVQNAKVNNESDSSSNNKYTRQKKKHKSKKRKRSKVNHFSKINDRVTSIPLAESSDSDPGETITKHQASNGSPATTERLKKVCRRISDLVDLPPSDLDDFVNSSDEDSSALSTAEKGIHTISIEKPNLSCRLTESPPFNEQRLGESQPFDLINKADSSVNTKNTSSAALDLTNGDSIAECCIKLRRDPEIDKQAEEMFLQTPNASTITTEVECILLSDEADTDNAPPVPRSSSGEVVENQPKNCAAMQDNLPEAVSLSVNDDCCIVPCKELSRASTVGDNRSCLLGNSDIDSTALNTQVLYPENSKFGDNEQSSEEFNIEIVSVESLVDSNKFIPSKANSEDSIEIIDLSEDDSDLQETTFKSCIPESVSSKDNTQEIIINYDELKEILANVNSMKPDNTNRLTEIASAREADNSSNFKTSGNCFDTTNNSRDLFVSKQSINVTTDKISENACSGTPNESSDSSSSKSSMPRLPTNIELPQKISAPSVCWNESSVNSINNVSMEAVNVNNESIKCQANNNFPTYELIDLEDEENDSQNIVSKENIPAKNLKTELVERKPMPLVSEDEAIPTVAKREVFEDSYDEMDVIAASFASKLNSAKVNPLTLIHLYKKEYQNYKNILNTKVNVSEGLRLLQENQVKKLQHLQSCIKNLVKHDKCYHKLIQEKYGTNPNPYMTKTKSEKNASSQNVAGQSNSKVVPVLSTEEIRYKQEGASSSKVMNSGSQCTSKSLKIEKSSSKDVLQNNIAAVSNLQPAQGSDSAVTSEQKLSDVLEIRRCFECGKPAIAICQGCESVAYCSMQCGMLSWNKGHKAVCKRK